MTNEHDLDDALRAALRDEDAELLARLERDADPGIFAVMRSGFRGRTAWWVWVTSATQVALFVLAVWTGVRFFGADTVDDRVYWGVLMLLTGVSTGVLKNMIWGHVGRNLLHRELKRVELQVAALGARLAERD